MATGNGEKYSRSEIRELAHAIDSLMDGYTGGKIPIQLQGKIEWSGDSSQGSRSTVIPGVDLSGIRGSRYKSYDKTDPIERAKQMAGTKRGIKAMQDAGIRKGDITKVLEGTIKPGRALLPKLTAAYEAASHKTLSADAKVSAFTRALKDAEGVTIRVHRPDDGAKWILGHAARRKL